MVVRQDLILEPRRRVILVALVGALMVVPVAVWRLIDGAKSDPGDFIFLAILLAGVALALEVAARVKAGRAYTAGAGLALVAASLSIWINLAVGIIGSEDNPVNLMYGGVIAVALVGALIARFRPRGMAFAMAGAAVAQLLAFIGALAAQVGFTGPITIFFVALWLIAAWLFGRAQSAPQVSS